MRKVMAGVLSLLLTVSLVLGNVSMPVQAAQTSDRVQWLVDNMTLEQKAGQMLQPEAADISPQEAAQYFIGSVLSGGGAAPSTGNSAQDWADRSDSFQMAAINGIRVGGISIPLLYGVDAVHGHNNVSNAVIFPHNIGLGQANDEELMEQIGAITAKAVRATGANWTFAPTLGLPKNERWGRTYECFSERAEISAAMGAALIRGATGDLAAENIIATAKHFVAEGITSGGVNQGNVPMDFSSEEFRKVLHEELLIPYISAIEAGARSVMVSYNSIGGAKCHGNAALLTGVLKGELGFDGIVISDYNGIDQIENTSSYADQVCRSVNAGMDMLMVAGGRKWYDALTAIVDGVNNGTIPMSRVNDAVTRILSVKEELGLLDDPYSALSNSQLLAAFSSDADRAVARRAVRESLVLLKNSETQNGRSTIMLDLADMDKLMVVGSSANDIGMQCGGWTISWQGMTGNITDGTTIYQGLKAAAGSGKTVDLSVNGSFSGTDYDAVIFVAGETPYAEYAGDRTAAELTLASSDIAALDRVKNAHPDIPVIAVLTVGRPITIWNQLDQFDAVIMAGLPGSEGAGVADVLLGNYDFTGTLTYTWPKQAKDIENKFTDPSVVLFPYGTSLTKSQVSMPEGGGETDEDSSDVTDLGQTGGVLEAEDYYYKDTEIQLENGGTTVGYFWENRSISYKINVPESGMYKIIMSTATDNTSVSTAMNIYVDGQWQAETSNILNRTGGWAVFVEQELDQQVALKAGVHTIEFQSLSRDFNMDYFRFIRTGDLPEEEEPGENPGTPVDGSVSVSMSSSEHSGDLSWYSTSYNIQNQNAEMTPLPMESVTNSNLTTITVNEDQIYQEVLGIGISMEESSVNNILKMSESARKEFIRKLVDPEDGMGVTLIRLTIGTADFTGRSFYTYYDGTGTELNGQPDWYNVTGNGFSIQKDIDYGVVGVVQEIIQAAEEAGVRNQLRFFSSPWTPPGWMKTATSASNSYSDNSKLLKGGKLNDAYINDLAKYYVRYMEEYQKLGIPIYAMTMQNEPMLEINYPSCSISGTQEAKLAKAIKEEVAKSTVLTDEGKQVKIWAFDHNFDGADSFVNELFATADGRNSVDGIAFHPYGGSASSMGSLYNRYQDQYTMHLSERAVWGTGGANDIITWFRNGSQSYNSWVTMLDSNISPHQWVGTPDPTIFVKDANSRDGYWCTPEVFITGQFSKYVRPGFVRIGSTAGSTSSVTNVAFKNSKTGEIVMVVANCSGRSQNFRTVVGNRQFTATIPAGNVATYRWISDESTETPEPPQDPDVNDITPIVVDGNPVVLTETQAYKTAGSFAPAYSGSYADYRIDVKKAGTYTITYTINGEGGGKPYPEALSVYTGTPGSTAINSKAAKTSGVDDLWTTAPVKVRDTIALQEGVQSLRIYAGANGFTLAETELALIAVTEIELDTAASMRIPIASYGEDNGNSLIIGSNLEYTVDGSTFDYHVNVKQAGTYGFRFAYAIESSENVQIRLNLVTDDAETVLGTVSAPRTGSWTAYNTTDYISGQLPAGKAVLRMTVLGNSANLQSIDVNCVELEAPAEEEEPLPFRDVAEGVWYYDSVKEVYELGIMTGNSAGTLFTPDGVMTRGMIVNVLYRLDGSPKTSYKADFKDVDAKKYYAVSVNWGVENGIVKGYSDNTFRPDTEITREQMVIILYYYAKYLGMDVNKSIDLSGYKDNGKIHSYALAPMKWAVAEGIMSGSSSGQLNPLQSVTRAQAARMLAEFNHLKAAAGK